MQKGGINKNLDSKKTLRQLLKELCEILEDSGYTTDFLDMLKKGINRKKK